MTGVTAVIAGTPVNTDGAPSRCSVLTAEGRGLFRAVRRPFWLVRLQGPRCHGWIPASCAPQRFYRAGQRRPVAPTGPQRQRWSMILNTKADAAVLMNGCDGRITSGLDDAHPSFKCSIPLDAVPG